MPKPRIQPVEAQFRELPGTQVGFWVVQCPFCGATHFHSAGARLADPLERLGQAAAPCGGEYILVRPQEKRKKSKKARRRDWAAQEQENSNFWEKQDWEDEEE